jgi:nucleotide-binding universal stress UspA family protein
MQRFALAPSRPTREQVLVAVPERAAHWTIASRNRGLHRLLVPIDASLRGVDALAYVVEHLADHVAGIHLVNVQQPIMTGNVTPLVTADTIARTRRLAGERVLALARDAYEDAGIPIVTEVAFGDPAKTICRVAEARGCTGIVVGRDGFELHDLIRGSVAARILRLASVPVTIVNSRTATVRAKERAALPQTRSDDEIEGRSAALE